MAEAIHLSGVSTADGIIVKLSIGGLSPFPSTRFQRNDEWKTLKGLESNPSVGVSPADGAH
ncbi:MAG: hypothetical protein JJ895_04710 [Balneolaceae bacterium]|nr:hypothetical protein [Balneolaceae bacterium]